MPSKKPARKRTRSPRKSVGLGLGGFLWILALANLAAGLGLSPATGLKTVTVKGANADESRLIQKRLQIWASVPWIRQSQSAMETSILADNRLAEAKVTTNIFGRGTAVVVPRVPVARIAADLGTKKEPPDFATYLDSRGTLYQDYWAEGFKGPDLELPAASRAMQLTVVPAWPLVSVANAAAKSQTFLGELPFKVVLDERSVLSLQVVDGPQIILGTDSDLDEKFDVLERAFREEKDKVLRYKSINVSAPDRPVYGS